MPNLIPPSLNDDRGNPLSSSRSPAEVLINSVPGKQRGKSDPSEGIPTGFTPNTAIEKGVDGRPILNSDSKPLDTNQKLRNNTSYQQVFNKDKSEIGFKYGMETSWDPNSKKKTNLIPSPDVDTSKIYLGSFLATSINNEDPTMMGYDIEIDYANSPLFNGSVEDFINTLPNTEEISSRLEIIKKFKEQFLLFFKTNSPNSAGVPDDAIIKTYYLKKITGLDKLVEGNLSNEFKRSFVNYGEDYIAITLNEDVTQNMGYLATLYKSLSWSRINGKQVIPANLLRFNLTLTITEIRKYTRVVHDIMNSGSGITSSDESLKFFPDLISKYTYDLYECQLFFPKMPHGDTLDMSAPSLIDGYDMQFNYKFSTMKFTKFKYKGDDVTDTTYIDNKEKNIGKVSPFDSEMYVADDRMVLQKRNQPYSELYTDISYTSPTQPSEHRFRNNLEKLGKDLANAAFNEVNRQVNTQAKLLNRTLDNIRNSIPLAGRMSAPTNVYEEDQRSLGVDVKNAVRGFVGRSVRGFFSK